MSETTIPQQVRAAMCGEHPESQAFLALLGEAVRAEIERLRADVETLRLQRDLLALNWEAKRDVPVSVVWRGNEVVGVTWPSVQSSAHRPVVIPVWWPPERAAEDAGGEG